MSVTFTDFSEAMRDMFPLPGQRIKQWVVDARRELAWEQDTCPRCDVAEHKDNTGATCRNGEDAAWIYLLTHDCCSTCNERAEQLRFTPAVHAWLKERSLRPRIERDRTKYSDEVQP